LFFLTLLVVLVATSLQAQTSRKLDLLYADKTEFVFSKFQDSTFVSGAVIFETETGLIYCDSAMLAKGEMVVLWGKVVLDDRDYRLTADSVRYDLRSNRAVAVGDYVELWSRDDSLFAVGRHAFFDRDRDYFYMHERPTVYMNYPDTSRMIEIVADFVEYDAANSVAEAQGNVRISSTEFTSTSGCAVMHPDDNSLDLFDGPILRRRESEISGRFITVLSDETNIRRVDVIDSAYAEFVEPISPGSTAFNRSVLSGERILMDFIAGDLRTVTCYDQAYSWYYPAAVFEADQQENSVSGDTIRFTVSNEQLRQVDVVGGAIGSYLSSRQVESEVIETDTLQVDSLETDTTTAAPSLTIITDTVDYRGDYISYSLVDSLITLHSSARTNSGAVSLEAYVIQFDTRARIIEAFSGDVAIDSLRGDNPFVDQLQPNSIPVILKDRDQDLKGDYLRYSIDTEKGRIVTSKSDYETGFFYGEELHRQQKDIFYLKNGRYTTCNADEPHFHFKSTDLKLIEGQKLIAKPVVFHLGRLPLIALPYYVFPLEKGRHSGILPFSLGNIERGELYISNVGYYWAASEYWDWKGALDYYEDRNRMNIFSSINYRKRYVFNGSVSGNWGRETVFDSKNINENRRARWTLKANHSHELSPSFKISASGDIRSDATFYNDYSTDLAERLNRIIRSQVTFSKRFGSSISISGSLKHDEHLDDESRIDRLPSLGVSLPAVRPFGSGTVDAEGQLQRRWYNDFIVTYRPRLENFSARNTLDSTTNTIIDSNITFDTNIVIIDTLPLDADTSIVIDTLYTLLSQDTLSYRTRKEYTRVDHSLNASLPLTIARYFVFNPSFRYAENWFKIHATDQSAAAGIDASTSYRSYRYDFGASFSTKLYGTVSPNLFGLIGLRQVLSPFVSYRYVPEIDRHPAISSYAGGSARSTSKSQSMSVSLGHDYQAKIRRGEVEQSYDLLSVKHAFSYNFEKDSLRFSNLQTRISSNLLRSVRLNASMTHSLYKGPQSSQLDFWNPHLLSFKLDANLSLRGKRFLFDDVTSTMMPRGADSANQVGNFGMAPRPTSAPGRRGWDARVSYSYSETGKWTDNFRKSSSVRFTLNFNLTPTTQVNYSQYYDFVSAKTVTNIVNITKVIHCWTGTFHWVPTGSTRGWGFRLYVTALPAIKIDDSQSPINSGYFPNVR
jgi:lipopolysaccharide assembly outer membrane protein LptD (OstA)